MSLTIIDPVQTVDGLVTNVLAIESQALYMVKREDFQFTAVTDIGGGVIQFTQSGAANYPVGTLIYVGGAVYEGLYTVTAILGGGNNLIQVNETFVSTDVGYINNNDLFNYNIEVEIRDSADTFSLFNQVYRYVPPQSGAINIDLQRPVMDYIKAANAFFSFSFFARFTEVYEGSSETPTDTSILQAVGYARKQYGSLGGALMREYLLNDVDSRLMVPTADKVAWKGWERSVSFLIDSNLAGRVTPDTDIRLNFFYLDINKGLIGGIPAVDYTIGDAEVIIQQLKSQIDIAISSANTQYISINATSRPSNTVVSETVYMKIENECHNPIMLDWLNSSGTPSQYLFTIKQTISLQVDEGVITERPVNIDYADVTRTKRRYRGATMQRMTLYAEGITIGQLRSLAEIKETESLRCYLSKDGTSFVDVIIVDDFSTSYETDDPIQTFSCTIEFPDDYDFYKAKLY